MYGKSISRGRTPGKRRSSRFSRGERGVLPGFRGGKEVFFQVFLEGEVFFPVFVGGRGVLAGKFLVFEFLMGVCMKRMWILACLVFVVLGVVSCGGREEADRGMVYNIYVLNKEESRIYSREYVAESTEQEDLIEELLAQLVAPAEKLEYRAPLSGNFELLGFSVEEKQLILNFDEQYKGLPLTTEVLARAAVVRTMTQIKGIDYVSFQIRSAPLTDSMGNMVGIMSADMFIDNAESEINSAEKVRVRLYFANEAGDRLVETNRTLVYNSSTNVSMERLVVEQLIAGPSEQVRDQVYPTINPETKIISIAVRDGICYVNLNENFLTQIYSVTSDVTIYSIANSLSELSNINKVQIAINGDSNVVFRENTSLAVTYGRNLDIVVTGP